MEILVALGTLIIFVYSIWIICYVFLLFWSMNIVPILIRNPPLLILNSFGLMLIGDVMIMFGFFDIIPCIVLRQSRMHIAPIVLMPSFLRGMQYLVTINEEYRKRFSRFKSTKFLLRCNFAFWIFHVTVAETLSRLSGVPENGCFPTWNAAYGFLMTIGIFAGIYKIFRLIPWSFDSYNIAEDLKHMYVLCAFALVFVMIVVVLIGALGEVSFGNILLSCIFFIPSIAIFFIMVVRPIHYFVFGNSKCYAYRKKRTRRKYLKHDLRKVEKKERCIKNLKASAQTMQGQLQVTEMVLKDRKAAETLHDFANRRLCAEVTLFLEQVHRYKHYWMTESSKESLARSNSIIEDFIQRNGPNSIRISEHLRNRILKSSKIKKEAFCREKLPREFFDECFEDMCKLFFANLGNAGDCDDFWEICSEYLDVETLIVSNRKASTYI